MKKFIILILVIFTGVWYAHRIETRTYNEQKNQLDEMQRQMDTIAAGQKVIEEEINNRLEFKLPDQQKEIGQLGTASWYDYDLAGIENYSASHRTAATRDWPRGTMLHVCSWFEKTKCVNVMVNDYGPDASVHPDRIIDLSSYAFKQLFPLPLS